MTSDDKDFCRLTAAQARRDLIAWWRANKDVPGLERPRLELEIVADPDGMTVVFPQRVYRRRRSRRRSRPRRPVDTAQK